AVAAIRAAVDAMLPPTDGKPGAAELGVERHVVEQAEGAMQGSTDLMAALLNAYADGVRSGTPFAELSRQQRVTVVRTMYGDGAVVAYALASKGVSVTMLEAGPWLDPDRDFSRLEDDMGGLVFGRLKWGPGDRSKPAWVRRRDGVGLALQAAGVGGTTLHYNGISPRAYKPAADAAWPFPYEEMIPYYERVEELLPVAMVRDLATKDALFAAGCEKIGLGRRES